jgi:PAS domain S-box-containing protein
VTPRLLVVDDDPDIALLCRVNLEAAGYEVAVAGDGREALDVLSRTVPDLVLLDVLMPDPDGWSVLATIRQNPATAQLPVVMLTARADDRDQLRAWQSGATDYVTKPFEPAALVAAVRGVLDPAIREWIERKRVELSGLLRSRGDEAYRLAAIVESSDDAVISASLDGTILTWNQGAERMFGYVAAEVIGQSATLLAPTEQEAELPDLLDRITRGERILHHDSARIRRDGVRIDVSISVSPILDHAGRVGGVSLIMRDVTERRRGDDRLKALLEAAPDAMVIVDSSGHILLVNAQTERLFGYERAELLGRAVEVLVPEHMRLQHPRHRLDYQARPRVRPMGAGLDLTGLRKDGSEFPVEISLSPLDTDEGVFVSAAIRDVTERRKAERALGEAYERERAASSRLRDLDQMKSDFLSTVSHELRTPLTSIKGFADTLLSHWDGIADDDRRLFVSRIANAGVRLEGLIGGLLDFSRLERGQLQLEPSEIDVAGLVQVALARVGVMLQHHDLEVDIADDLTVHADRSAMVRSLENLLTNAAKFSPGGSKVRVDASEDDDGKHVVLRVADQGPGIPAEEADRVFERFYRIRTANQIPGTGIGLAIVKEFVEAQGGRAWVETPEKGGARVCMSLPRAG